MLNKIVYSFVIKYFCQQQLSYNIGIDADLFDHDLKNILISKKKIRTTLT